MSTTLSTKNASLCLVSGMSVQEVASQARLSETTIYSMMRRNLLEKPMLLSSAEGLAKAFGMSVDLFVLYVSGGDYGIISDIRRDHLKDRRGPKVQTKLCPSCFTHSNVRLFNHDDNVCGNCFDS